MINESTLSKNQHRYSAAEDIYKSRAIAATLAKSNVPISHKRIADNYMIIQKIFKFQACTTKISNMEKALLEKYDFASLDSTTMSQMYEELSLLQQWTNDSNEELKNIAENILLIRIKELKYLESNCYATVSNELYNGYKVLRQYLCEISRYSTAQRMGSF